MPISKLEMEVTCFRFMNGALPLKDFEDWLYATPELENWLGECTYFELISFDFRQRFAEGELRKLLREYIQPGSYATWEIKRLLAALLDESIDGVPVFEELYERYCHGHKFLSNVGLPYVLAIDEIPKLAQQEFWDPAEFKRRRDLLKEYIRFLKPEIEQLLQGLENGEMKIIDEAHFQMEPGFALRLNEISRPLAQAPKQWWKSCG